MPVGGVFRAINEVENTIKAIHVAASLPRNYTGIQTFKKVYQQVPLKTPAVHNYSCCVQSSKVANRLAQSNAQDFDIHQNAPLYPLLPATTTAV
ncbi:MAG: hypothetical protein WBC93_09640 [Sulfitobacter sp.]